VTAAIKDELSRLSVGSACCRRAEVSAVLRFAGGVYLAAGRVQVQAELDNALVARRLRREIGELFGDPAAVWVLPAGSSRPGPRYLVRVEHGAALARFIGLIDQAGRPVRGVPPMVVTGGGCAAAAAWRGAFMARGSLTGSGRSAALQVSCPGPEEGLALVGAARRLGVLATSTRVRGADRVLIRDSAAVGVLLHQLGASQGVLAWQEQQLRRQMHAGNNGLATFDDPNQRRSATAAAATVTSVQEALALLTGQNDEQLLVAGRLRLAHPQASLEQLGALADPPMTRDAVAGRLRRLLARADRRAVALGLPTTRAAASPGLLPAVDQG